MYIHIYTYTCIYIYTHMYIYIYTHTYIYIYTILVYIHTHIVNHGRFSKMIGPSSNLMLSDVWQLLRVATFGCGKRVSMLCLASNVAKVHLFRPSVLDLPAQGCDMCTNEHECMYVRTYISMQCMYVCNYIYMYTLTIYVHIYRYTHTHIILLYK